MSRNSTTNWSLFPPQTGEVQVDEKWAFVGQKEASCDPLDPLDRLRGDDWDHTAVDPESRLLLCLVPGKRDGAVCEQLIREVHDRTAGRTDLLITSDEYAPYETAIREVYGVETPQPKRPGPGRPPKAKKVIPPDLCYATVLLLSQLTEPRPGSSGRKRLGPGVPVVDPRLHVTPQDTADRLGDLPRRRGALPEQFGEDRSHLRHRHRRGFPPRVAAAPGPGTTGPTARA
jgi:hypothetical protein